MSGFPSLVWNFWLSCLLRLRPPKLLLCLQVAWSRDLSIQSSLRADRPAFFRNLNLEKRLEESLEWLGDLV